MTAPQQMLMQSVIKFGAVTVFAVVFYIESVRPQIKQNIATQKSVTEANMVNAKTQEKMAEAAAKSADTHSRMAVTLDGIKKVLEGQHGERLNAAKHEEKTEDDEKLE